MKVFSQLAQESGQLVEEAGRYADLQKERIQVEIASRVITSITDLVYMLAVGLFGFGFAILLCLGLGIVLGQWADSLLVGCAVSVGTFLFFFLIMAIFGKRIIEGSVFPMIWKAVYTDPKK